MTYTEAVQSGNIVAWMKEHPQRPMDEPVRPPEPVPAQLGEQLELFEGLRAA